MSAQLPDFNPVIDAIPGRELPGAVKNIAFACMAFGVIGLGYGFGTGNLAWTWGSFLAALVWTLALAQGGVIFAVIMTLTHGRWGMPVKRLGEAFGLFLPFGYLALLVLLVAGNGLYPWHDGTFLFDGNAIDLHPHSPAALSTKPMWLSLPFWMARQAGSFALLIVLDFMYLKASLGPDMVLVIDRLKETAPSWTAPSWWSHFTKGYEGTTVSDDAGKSKRELFAALIAVTYPLVFSFMAFDLVMSLAPWWYANMFGVWIFVSSFWIGLCGIGIITNVTKNWLNISEFIGSNVTHDIGKLALACCMFWGYTTYAQILPIWYTNMPEETDFLLIRMQLPQWAWLTWTVGVMCFIAPFTILLSRGIKKMRWPFVGLLAFIMTGLFFERTLDVLPSVYMADTFPIDLFLVTSFGIWAGFIGAFTLVVSKVLVSLPPIAFTDERLQPHPWDEHVHSLDAHH